MGVTHANKVYKKKLQKAPTSVVVSYTNMEKRSQCKGGKHQVKDNVLRRLRKEEEDNFIGI